MADRDGFLIKNVSQVGADLPVAEADKGDFIILGNARYGVLSGMVCTRPGDAYSGLITSAEGTLLVNGEVVTATVASVTAPGTTSGNSRFDLVVYDLDVSGVRLVTGTASPSGHPVFPDITETMVPLCSVYVSPESTFQITDKRNMLSTEVVGLGVDKVVIVTDGTGAELFHMGGSTGGYSPGWMKWIDGTEIRHSGVKEITIIDDVEVANLNASTNIYINHRPVALKSDIPLNSTPIGTIITSASAIVPTGWAALDGSTIPKSVLDGQGDDAGAPVGPASTLWELLPGWIVNGQFTTPRMTGMVPMLPMVAGELGDPSLTLTPPTVALYYYVKL